MSAQFEDIYIFQNKSYSIIKAKPSACFEPKEYGLEPDTDCCSACWKGFHAVFSIVEKRLFIKDLFIETKDQIYPSIAGVQVKFQKEVDYFTFFPVYESLSLFVPYTGKLLVGEGFLKEYYVHLGYQRLWAYQEVKELIFKDGILVEINDLSNLAAQLRAACEGKRKLMFWQYEKTEAMKPYLNEWWC